MNVCVRARECVCVPIEVWMRVLRCVLPVWPCLSAITPLSGNIKKKWTAMERCHGGDIHARTHVLQRRWSGLDSPHMHVPFNRLRGKSRCQDGNYYSNLNKWCRNCGCSNAATAALAYCSLEGPVYSGMCQLKKPLQIRSTWEAHWDRRRDECGSTDIQMLLCRRHRGPV